MIQENQLKAKQQSYKDKIRNQLKKKYFDKSSYKFQKLPSSDSSIETPVFQSQDQSGLEFEEEYELLEKLGEGAHAVVYKCQKKKKDKKIYAVKQFRTSDPEIIATIRKTYQISQMIHHPNIVRVYELYINEQNGYTYQVMEYCNYPSLESTYTQLKENDIKLLMRQLLDAIFCIHKIGVCHRDLKPDNILFNGQHVKLIDFGVSKRFYVKNKQIDMWTSTGTSYYCAPEIYEGGGYTYKIDMWAFGVILYQCLTKELPFQDETVYGTIDLIRAAQFKKDHPLLNQQTRDLLSRLLNPDPKRRLNANDATIHLWFGGNNQQGKTNDDMIVHNGFANNSSLLYDIMSQSSQKDDNKTEIQPQVEAITKTIHVRQKSQKKMI